MVRPGLMLIGVGSLLTIIGVLFADIRYPVLAVTVGGVTLGLGLGAETPRFPRRDIVGVLSLIAGVALALSAREPLTLAFGAVIAGAGLSWFVGASFVGAVAGIGAMVVAALGFAYLVLSALKGSGGAPAEGWQLLFAPPFSLARAFSILTVALLMVAAVLTPITWLETRSLRRFARREEELRRERPDASVTPYSGDEGEGVAFDGPAGRLLLLKPVAGIGAPREVVLAPPAADGGGPDALSVPPVGPPEAPERPSPVDSSP